MVVLRKYKLANMKALKISLSYWQVLLNTPKKAG